MSDETKKEPKEWLGGTATEDMVADIVANPEAYGFTWKEEPISAKNDKDGKLLAPDGKKMVLRANAPRPYLPETQEHVAAFFAAFGPSVLARSANGTSVDVAAEDIIRRELLAEWNKDRARSVSNTDLKTEIVKRVLLGKRAAGGGGSRTRWVYNGVIYATEAEALEASKAPTQTYKGLDGKEYPTALEAKQASVAHLVDQGFPQDLALKAVAGMAE